MLWLFVGPTGVYLLDFFCPGIQFYLLLGPCLCFVSLLCFGFVFFFFFFFFFFFLGGGGGCIGELGVFHANQVYMCLDPHLN